MLNVDTGTDRKHIQFHLQIMLVVELLGRGDLFQALAKMRPE